MEPDTGLRAVRWCVLDRGVARVSRYRAEIREKAAQQPDHRKVTRCLGRQAPARPHPVEIPIEIQLQQIGGIIAGALRRPGPRAAKAQLPKIEIIDERRDEPYRVVGCHIIIDRRRKQQRLVPGMSLNVTHARSY